MSRVEGVIRESVLQSCDLSTQFCDVSRWYELREGSQGLQCVCEGEELPCDALCVCLLDGWFCERFDVM